MIPLGGPPEIASRQVTYPDQPWRWRHDWEEGRIRSGTRRSVRSAWFVATFVVLIGAPLIFVVLREWPRNRLVALALAFPLFGLWLVAAATWVTLRWRRFGETWFAMDPLPASPGGRLQGTVHARLPVGAPHSHSKLLLQLTCLRRIVRRSSDDVDVSEPIVWRDEHEIPFADLSAGPAGAAIPVAFDLPPDALETTGAGQAEGVFWVLTAKASLPGVDLHEEYDVPVHRTAAAHVRRARGTPRSFVEVPIAAEDLACHGIRVTTTEGRLEVRCAQARNPSFLVGMTIMTFIWAGAWWIQSVLGVPWIIQGATLAVLALLVVVCVDLWLSTTTVTIDDGRVTRRYELLGVGTTKSWRTTDISKVFLRIGSQTQGRTGVPYYDIRASLNTAGLGNRTLMLAPRIRHKRHAEWLVARFSEALALSEREIGPRG